MHVAKRIQLSNPLKEFFKAYWFASENWVGALLENAFLVYLKAKQKFYYATSRSNTAPLALDTICVALFGALRYSRQKAQRKLCRLAQR